MMNERIRELVAEAGATLDQDFYQNLVGITMGPQELEEFAKLIVKECAGIYSKIDNGNQHMGTDDYLEALQKHFGVEE